MVASAVEVGYMDELLVAIVSLSSFAVSNYLRVDTNVDKQAVSLDRFVSS